jgi:hypothetical protein
VGQPGPSEVFTFAEIHEDVIDDGSFAQADPGAWVISHHYGRRADSTPILWMATRLITTTTATS